MEIVYSRTRHPATAGRRALNPRFFTSPEAGVSRVLLVGDWPRIESAYRALGVPVERVDAPPTIPPPETAIAPASLAPQAPADERARIYIPEDWMSLPYSRADERDLTLRGLAAMFSETPVLNKAQAVEAIEAELERRAEAASATD